MVWKERLYISLNKQQNITTRNATATFNTTEKINSVDSLRTLFVEAKGVELEKLIEVFYVDLMCTIKEQQNIKGEELKEATNKVFNEILFSKF